MSLLWAMMTAISSGVAIGGISHWPDKRPSLFAVAIAAARILARLPLIFCAEIEAIQAGSGFGFCVAAMLACCKDGAGIFGGLVLITVSFRLDFAAASMRPRLCVPDDERLRFLALMASLRRALEFSPVRAWWSHAFLPK